MPPKALNPRTHPPYNWVPWFLPALIVVHFFVRWVMASSLFFLFGPSAFTLHLADILICAFLLFMAFRIGTLAGGRPVGLLAAGFWAFAPL